MGFSPDEYTGKTFGKYEVLCRLAVGGMAEIFLGFAKSGPFAFQPLVLKRLLQDQREDPTAMRLLIDEARNMATLNHPNVARVFDLEVTSDEVLLVIQFINGANLEELIKAAHEHRDLLPVPFVLSVMRDAALGLNHAHVHKDANGQPRPIVHRDVTPRNIMVGFDGKARVLDFGIARKVGGESRTMAGMVRGTTAYMSPEQAIGNPPDHRSDLFSLGTLLHEALVGQRLFSRESPAKEMAAVYEAAIPFPSVANRRVPKSIDPLVMKLLERQVHSRYQSATDFVRDLALLNTTWPPERCGDVVRSLFAARQQSLSGLLDRVAAAAGLADETTRAGVPGLMDDDPEPRTMIDRPNLARATAMAAASGTNTNPNLDVRGALAGPPSVVVEVATDPGGRPLERKTDPSPRPGDEAAVPTNLFRPRFGEADPGPAAAAADGELTSASAVTSTGLEKRRSWPLVLGAAGAMVIGAVGGAVVYGTLQGGMGLGRGAQASSAGVGRVSIGSDRPAEVQLGGQILGQTPVVDVYLPSGNTVVRLREPNGPWREAVLNVKKDQVNRFEVKLDSLPVAP